MTTLSEATAWWGPYSGSGPWLDQSGNDHHAALVGSPVYDDDHWVLTVSNRLTVPHDAGFVGEEMTVVALHSTPGPNGVTIAQIGVGWTLHTIASGGPKLFFDTYWTGAFASVTFGQKLLVAGGYSGTEEVFAQVGASRVTQDGDTVESPGSTPLSFFAGHLYAAAVFDSYLSAEQVVEVGAALLEATTPEPEPEPEPEDPNDNGDDEMDVSAAIALIDQTVSELDSSVRGKRNTGWWVTGNGGANTRVELLDRLAEVKALLVDDD